MNIDKIRDEIDWYTEEIKINKKSIENARLALRESESSFRTNERKLEELKLKLRKAEAEEKEK
jgi:uncharacterized coiled-coil DUF342 family protein